MATNGRVCGHGHREETKTRLYDQDVETVQRDCTQRRRAPRTVCTLPLPSSSWQSYTRHRQISLSDLPSLAPVPAPAPASVLESARAHTNTLSPLRTPLLLFPRHPMGGLTLDLRPGAGLGAFNLGTRLISSTFLSLALSFSSSSPFCGFMMSKNF